MAVKFYTKQQIYDAMCCMVEEQKRAAAKALADERQVSVEVPAEQDHGRAAPDSVDESLACVQTLDRLLKYSASSAIETGNRGPEFHDNRAASDLSITASTKCSMECSNGNAGLFPSTATPATAMMATNSTAAPIPNTGNSTSTANSNTVQQLFDRTPHRHELPSDHALSIIVCRALYPVSEELLRPILAPFGVKWLVVNPRTITSTGSPYVRAIVELNSRDAAVRAHVASHGKCLFDDCGYLDVRFALPFEYQMVTITAEAVVASTTISTACVVTPEAVSTKAADPCEDIILTTKLLVKGLATDLDSGYGTKQIIEASFTMDNTLQIITEPAVVSMADAVESTKSIVMSPRLENFNFRHDMFDESDSLCLDTVIVPVPHVSDGIKVKSSVDVNEDRVQDGQGLLNKKDVQFTTSNFVVPTLEQGRAQPPWTGSVFETLLRKSLSLIFVKSCPSSTEKMQHSVVAEKFKPSLPLEMHLLVFVVMRKETLLWTTSQSTPMLPWDPGALMYGMCTMIKIFSVVSRHSEIKCSPWLPPIYATFQEDNMRKDMTQALLWNWFVLECTQLLFWAVKIPWPPDFTNRSTCIQHLPQLDYQGMSLLIRTSSLSLRVESVEPVERFRGSNGIQLCSLPSQDVLLLIFYFATCRSFNLHGTMYTMQISGDWHFVRTVKSEWNATPTVVMFSLELSELPWQYFSCKEFRSESFSWYLLGASCAGLELGGSEDITSRKLQFGSLDELDSMLFFLPHARHQLERIVVLQVELSWSRMTPVASPDTRNQSWQHNTNWQNPRYSNGWNFLLLLLGWFLVPFLLWFWRLLSAVLQYISYNCNAFLACLYGSAALQHILQECLHLLPCVERNPWPPPLVSCMTLSTVQGYHPCHTGHYGSHYRTPCIASTRSICLAAVVNYDSGGASAGQGKLSWALGIGTLLCFYMFFTDSAVPGEGMLEASTYCCIHYTASFNGQVFFNHVELQFPEMVYLVWLVRQW